MPAEMPASTASVKSGGAIAFRARHASNSAATSSALFDAAHSEFIDFHLQTIGCRYCLANLEDLRRQQQETAETVKTRRTKYFQSTAGHLKRDK